MAPTIFQAVVNGLNAIDEFNGSMNADFLGVGLTSARKSSLGAHRDAWYLQAFATGPMTLDRSSFAKIREHADAYCGIDGFDEYNWYVASFESGLSVLSMV